LQAGRGLHVAARPLELEIGPVDHQGGGRVGGGEGAVTPGILDLDLQAELHGFVGHEIAAQAETLPDFEGFLGLLAGGLPGRGGGGPDRGTPAGKIAVGIKSPVDQGVAPHFHFRSRVGQGGEPENEQGRRGEKRCFFHASFLVPKWYRPTWPRVARVAAAKRRPAGSIGRLQK